MGQSHLRVEPIKEAAGLIQIPPVSERTAPNTRNHPVADRITQGSREERHANRISSRHRLLNSMETSMQEEVKWKNVFIFTSLPPKEEFPLLR